MTEPQGSLPRLGPEAYRGLACVHWSMTIDDRKTGWLKPIFYDKFRELLTHTCFRYGLACPIFCLMPDHLHLLGLGLVDSADQRLAMKAVGWDKLALERWPTMIDVVSWAMVGLRPKRLVPPYYVASKAQGRATPLSSTSPATRSGNYWCPLTGFANIRIPGVCCQGIPI